MTRKGLVQFQFCRAMHRLQCREERLIASMVAMLPALNAKVEELTALYRQAEGEQAEQLKAQLFEALFLRRFVRRLEV